MLYLPEGKKIPVEWTILRGTSAVEEDFSRADIAVFIVGCADNFGWKEPIGRRIDGKTETGVVFDVVGGKLKFEIPNWMPIGVYGFRAVWVKDGFKRVQAEKMGCVMITDAVEQDKPVGTIKIRTGVSTYGYDGMDAYELSVLRGYTNLSLDDWLCQESVKVDTQSNILHAGGKTYRLSPTSSADISYAPEVTTVVESDVWSRPVISLEYDGDIPAEGNAVMTPKFSYYQERIITYKGITEPIVLKTEGSSTAVITWEGADENGVVKVDADNTSGATKEFTVKVTVKDNGIDSTKTVTLKQPARAERTVVSTEYSLPEVELEYGTTIPNEGATGVEPTKFTYKQTKTTKYSYGADVVEEITTGATLAWSGTNGTSTSKKDVAANTQFSVKTYSVSVTVVLNGRTVVKTATIRQAPRIKAQTSVVYTFTRASLQYPVIDSAGGDANKVSPVLSYAYKKVVNYDDGSSDTTNNITTGATVSYKNSSTSAAIANGIVSASANTNTTERDVCEVECTLTIGGGSGVSGGDTKTLLCTVKQAGSGVQTEYMYYGAYDGGVPNDAGIIEDYGTKVDAKEGDVSVTTKTSDQMLTHFIAFKNNSQYSVSKATDAMGFDITDDVNLVTNVGGINGYKVYVYGTGGYINNTTKYTVTKN